MSYGCIRKSSIERKKEEFSGQPLPDVVTFDKALIQCNPHLVKRDRNFGSTANDPWYFLARINHSNTDPSTCYVPTLTDNVWKDENLCRPGPLTPNATYGRTRRGVVFLDERLPENPLDLPSCCILNGLPFKIQKVMDDTHRCPQYQVRLTAKRTSGDKTAHLAASNPRTFVYLISPSIKIHSFIYPLLEKLYGTDIVQSIYPLNNDYCIKNIQRQIDWLNGLHSTSPRGGILAKRSTLREGTRGSPFHSGSLKMNSRY